MSAATLTAVHAFTASAEDRRRCTCGKSRNTAVHGYDKNARAAAKAEPADDALPEVVSARVLTEEEQAALPGAAEAAAVQAALESPADARHARTVELAEAVASGSVSFDAAAAELLGGAPVTLAEAREDLLPAVAEQVDDAELADALAAAGIEVEEETPAPAPKRVALGSYPERKAPAAKKAAAPAGEPVRSLWVAAAFVPIILADTAPERASLVAKVDASVPNARGGRTIRVTRQEAEELSAIGTEIETAALEAGGRDAGRLAHSAVTMRARLAALFS